MGFWKHEKCPSIPPIQNWIRLFGLVLLMALSLFLDVKDYWGYFICAFGITESIVKIHGFMAGLPISISGPCDLEDTPENRGMRVAIFFAGVIIFFLCIWMMIHLTLN